MLFANSENNHYSLNDLASPSSCSSCSSTINSNSTIEELVFSLARDPDLTRWTNKCRKIEEDNEEKDERLRTLYRSSRELRDVVERLVHNNIINFIIVFYL